MEFRADNWGSDQPIIGDRVSSRIGVRFIVIGANWGHHRLRRVVSAGIQMFELLLDIGDNLHLKLAPTTG
jgi:hypothetical protein